MSRIALLPSASFVRRHGEREAITRTAGVSGYGGGALGASRSLATGEITELLASGMETREIVRRIVATGDWSEAGAVGFVSFLADGKDAPAPPVSVAHHGRRGDPA